MCIRDSFDVVQRVSKQNESGAKGSVPGMKKVLSIRLTLMTPVKPMLVCVTAVLVMFAFQFGDFPRQRPVSPLRWQ